MGSPGERRGAMRELGVEDVVGRGEGVKCAGGWQGRRRNGAVTSDRHAEERRRIRRVGRGARYSVLRVFVEREVVWVRVWREVLP
jgi:hypothetical protein